MNTAAGEVLGAMITPAVLISASGTRVLSAEADAAKSPGGTPLAPRRAVLIGSQLGQLARRALLLRRALTSFYIAIGLLVAASIGIAIVVLIQWRGAVLAVAPGIAGAVALLYGSLLLLREGRLAVITTLEEMAYAREAVGG